MAFFSFACEKPFLMPPREGEEMQFWLSAESFNDILKIKMKGVPLPIPVNIQKNVFPNSNS